MKDAEYEGAVKLARWYLNHPEACQQRELWTVARALVVADNRLSRADSDSVVTSPPYWGLRDYGTGLWEGGEDGCDHKGPPIRTRQSVNENWGEGYSDVKNAETRAPFRETCGKCGARRIDNQLGLEPTPELYVERMVAVFREVRRVLRRDGTCWLNIGDSYATKPGNNDYHGKGPDTSGLTNPERQARVRNTATKDVPLPLGLKPKDLVGIPWRLAFALQQPYYTGRIKDERDRIWLAATIEAEGCLFIHKRKVGQPNGQGYVRKTDSYGAGLEVSSTDRVVVERCMEIAGIGSICEQSPDQNARRKQTLYRWNVRTNECRWIIRELYPHLLAKQHEARLLIGCPSSGEDARKTHESLKALHQGQTACIDFREPEGMWERGWFLRSEIIWSKEPNPMPESVSDRPTKAHETVFLLTKEPRYFFDQEAVREPAEYGRGIGTEWSRLRNGDPRDKRQDGPGTHRHTFEGGRNVRSVWEIATQPYPKAHFATFPEELVRRCVLAGSSERGACPECGAPWEREVDVGYERCATGGAKQKPTGRGDAARDPSTRTDLPTARLSKVTQTLGWRPTCECYTPRINSFGWDVGALPIVPCTVLDPFVGSGTVPLVARKHGRHTIGIDLSEPYLELAAKRLSQLSLLTEAQ